MARGVAGVTMVRLKSEVAATTSSGADEFLLTFSKVQGLGNDFVVVSEEHFKSWIASSFGNNPPPVSEIARKLCNRNFGIGADGLILVSLTSKTCDVGWTYINSDGSDSVMCGNGLRCLAHWCVTNEIVAKRTFTVETGKGPVQIHYEDPDRITTNLGEPILNSEAIPVAQAGLSSVVAGELKLCDRIVKMTALSMGNPHAVLFDSGISPNEFERVAREIQRHEYFPRGVNVSFVTAYHAASAEVTVWERGCGPTLACASAAAAVLVAGVMEGKLERRATIGLPGGKLIVEWRDNDNNVLITGPVRTSFTGSISCEALEAVP